MTIRQKVGEVLADTLVGFVEYRDEIVRAAAMGTDYFSAEELTKEKVEFADGLVENTKFRRAALIGHFCNLGSHLGARLPGQQVILERAQEKRAAKSAEITS